MITISNSRQEVLAIRLIIITVISQVAISIPAWIPGIREVPELPVLPFEIPTNVNQIVSTIFLLAWITSCLLILLKTDRAIGFQIFTASSLGLALLDLTRFQPWLFAYLVLLLPFALPFIKRNKETFFRLCIYVLAGTYLWSGFHKLNPFFPNEMFPFFADGFGQLKLARETPELGLAAAVFECLTGVLFLLNPTRKYALWMAIIMHLTILVVLSPLGHDWNRVVWPWNILYIALAWMAVKNISEPLSIKRLPGIEKVVIILMLVLPAGNIFSAWPHFLSGSFYSSLLPNSGFIFPSNAIGEIPPGAAPFMENAKGAEKKFLRVDQWILDDLKLPLFSQEYVHRQLGKKLCQCLSVSKEAEVVVLKKDRFSGEKDYQRYPCADLLR